MILTDWLALVIGNSRFHWAYFHGKELQQTWDSSEAIIPDDWRHLCLYIASVTKITSFPEHPYQRLIQLQDIPLKGLYSTLGVDRALALWGAMEVWGYPCLVIDGGTALTFTGANQHGEFQGGAILPGLALQLNSLAMGTAALPGISLPETLPPIWAKSTPEAISSGVIYTVLEGISQFIAKWWAEFPQSPVIFTGGDGDILKAYLTQLHPEIACQVKYDSNLVFWGMRSLVTS
ncbi:pantothenate kinase [Gloeocapsa sp. PCC 73106]|uniref:pantothenate kinase n=1 Tax=Gloeocapsa sp. PCC 73106 TaxID=102232 RepID=UPI0002ACB97A|nr:pantothenate kinase [Gloeocapsa sp. PCC 73106]ELR98340.1 pantothenate kinase, type III [Gloeocapsa sp. PCC 73106]